MLNIQEALIITDESKSLLPIVGAPIINYTIEFLSSSGLTKIYIFCCSDEIEEYINNSQWIRELNIEIIKSKSARNVGDALREIYSKDIIKSDFVLIQGDIITNLNLSKILKKHNKNSIITMVFGKGRGNTIIVTDAFGKLIFYENNPNTSVIKFPVIDEVEIRCVTDLGISICKNDILDIFNENFDYCNMEPLLLQNEIYVSVIDEYAAKVVDLKTYNSVSKDIIRGWAYPLSVNFFECSQLNKIEKFNLMECQTDIYHELTEWLPSEDQIKIIHNFAEEVRHIVMNGISNNISIDNIILDINSRKYAHDKSILECAKEITFSIFDSIDNKITNASELLKQTQNIFTEWKPLLSNFLTDESAELIWFLQEYCVNSKFEPLFAHILVHLYNLDIINDESIFEWEKESLEGKDKKFVKKCSAFLEKLKEETESSSEN